MISAKLTAYAKQKFAAQLPYLQGIREELDAALRESGAEEAVLLRLFYGTMPLSDAGAYSPEIFLSYIRHALFLRRELPRCAALPEDLFVRDVLYYRVNSEKIEDCRAFFWRELSERIRGLCMHDAVLEINYWAAEHVSYRASDARTLSPLAVWRSGDGRCGEESAFVVHALRACGIPARQIYVPRWAHCDDNHAWVEAYVDGDWHYLGACEPEAVLDRGWFDGAASRALLIHAREFCGYGLTDGPGEADSVKAAGTGLPEHCLSPERANQSPGPERDSGSELPEGADQVIGREGAAILLNRTAAYADTCALRILVQERSGAPVPGAQIRVEILNMAEFCPCALLSGNARGEALLRTGLGGFRLSARNPENGACAERLVDTRTEREITLTLEEWQDGIPALWNRTGDAPAAGEEKGSIPAPGGADVWRAFSLAAPAEHILRAACPTREQKTANAERLETCRRLRAEKLAGLSPVFETGGDPLRELFLAVLSEKDRKDAGEEIFADAMSSLRYASAWPRKVWEESLFCQRVELEELTPYRGALRRRLGAVLLQSFADLPERVAQYVNSSVSSAAGRDYDALAAPPEAVLRLGFGSFRSRKILAVALLRTAGVPARIHAVTGDAEYYNKETWSYCPLPVDPDEAPRARGDFAVLIPETGGESFHYAQNWTIARFDPDRGSFETLQYCGKAEEDGRLPLRLEEGCYRVITTVRNPSGDQYVREITFRLTAGEDRRLPLVLAEIPEEDLPVHCHFEDFELVPVQTDAARGEKDCGRASDAGLFPAEGADASAVPERKSFMAELGGRWTLTVFLEPGEEPTEHVLAELSEQAQELACADLALMLIARDEASLRQQTVRETLVTLPFARSYIEPEGTAASAVARRLYVEPDKLPLLFLTDPEGTAVYGSSGYNVGSVAMAIAAAARGKPENM